jgi:hypothetical protein
MRGRCSVRLFRVVEFHHLVRLLRHTCTIVTAASSLTRAVPNFQHSCKCPIRLDKLHLSALINKTTKSLGLHLYFCNTNMPLYSCQYLWWLWSLQCFKDSKLIWVPCATMWTIKKSKHHLTCLIGTCMETWAARVCHIQWWTWKKSTLATVLILTEIFMQTYHVYVSMPMHRYSCQDQL